MEPSGKVRIRETSFRFVRKCVLFGIQLHMTMPTFIGGDMNKLLAIALMLIVAAGSVSAQQEKQEKETRVVIEQKKDKTGFYTIRFGAWWPEDQEKEFRIGENLYDQTDAQIEQSQALGLDFHFRKMMTHPMYFDVSAGAWYTSYSFDFKDAVSNIEEEFENVDAWAVIVPVTLGLSVQPLPPG